MLLAAIVLSAIFGLTGSAIAQEAGAAPSNWETDFQPSATQVMDYIQWFSWYTVVIMSLIVLLVVGLITWCVWRFNERTNPVPSRVTHHTIIEVMWTVLPVLILVAIAIPSFRLLYGQYDPSKLYADFDPDTAQFMTVKVVGQQWFWDVAYSNDEDSAAHGVAEPITLSQYPIPNEAIDPAAGQLRNLSTDTAMVVPLDVFVRVQVTAEGDAIHALALPAFGIKADAVPGRLNETYFKAEREGIFYGQCSELCGKDHAFMPITVRVVSQEQFRTWARTAATDLDAANATLAAALRTDAQVAAR